MPQSSPIDISGSSPTHLISVRERVFATGDSDFNRFVFERGSLMEKYMYLPDTQRRVKMKDEQRDSHDASVQTILA